MSAVLIISPKYPDTEGIIMDLVRIMVIMDRGVAPVLYVHQFSGYDPLRQ